MQLTLKPLTLKPLTTGTLLVTRQGFSSAWFIRVSKIKALVLVIALFPFSEKYLTIALNRSMRQRQPLSCSNYSQISITDTSNDRASKRST